MGGKKNISGGERKREWGLRSDVRAAGGEGGGGDQQEPQDRAVSQVHEPVRRDSHKPQDAQHRNDGRQEDARHARDDHRREASNESEGSFYVGVREDDCDESVAGTEDQGVPHLELVAHHHLLGECQAGHHDHEVSEDPGAEDQQVERDPDDKSAGEARRAERGLLDDRPTGGGVVGREAGLTSFGHDKTSNWERLIITEKRGARDRRSRALSPASSSDDFCHSQPSFILQKDEIIMLPGAHLVISDRLFGLLSQISERLCSALPEKFVTTDHLRLCQSRDQDGASVNRCPIEAVAAATEASQSRAEKSFRSVERAVVRRVGVFPAFCETTIGNEEPVGVSNHRTDDRKTVSRLFILAARGAVGGKLAVEIAVASPFFLGSQSGD